MTDNNKKDPLKEFLEAVLSTSLPKLPEGSVCFCGSCTDAMEAAGRLLKQTDDNQECILWFVQVASAMRTLSVAALARGYGVPADAFVGRMKDMHPAHIEAVTRANNMVVQAEQKMYDILDNTTADSFGRRIVELADHYHHG